MERIVNLACWQNSGRVRCEPLEGGITNRNYLVHDGDERFVVRLCEDRRFLGIDRTNERLCAQAAARAGIAPRVTHFEDGILVTEFIEGRTLTDKDVGQPELLQRLAESLKQLHESTSELTGELLFFCPFQTVRTYFETATEAGASVPEGIEELVTDASTVREFSYAPKLCHNDLLAANIIDDGDRLWILDWEYAGIGQNLFDLASVSANCGLDEALEETLLTAYHGAATGDHLQTMHILKTVSLLREALWSLIQSVKSDIEFDYHQYAANNLAAYRQAREQIP